MHQHPRPPPVVASPANSDQTNPTRTNNPIDRDVQHLRTTSTQESGSSEDFNNNRQDTTSDANPTAQMQRLNQVIQNFHTKAALVILRSRVDLPEAYSSKSNDKRVNRWFNIELDETDEYNDDIRRWRKCDLKSNRPPPLVIEVFLTTDTLPPGQRLVILDEEEKRWDVSNALSSSGNAKERRRAPENDEVLLERWTIELDEPTSNPPADLTSVLPLVYKKSIVLFRSLYTYCNFLPAWKLTRKVGKGRHNMAMRVGYRILDGSRMQDLPRPDNLEVPLCDSTTDVTTLYSFGVTESPAGPFSVKVRYRENCDFRIDDTEELLSSRFIGADDDLFRPSLPHEDQTSHKVEGSKVGSLPNDARRNLRERPELGRAYGSMSTFHQAGFSPGTSPISALRSARELGQGSPTAEQTRTQPQSPGQGRSSLRAAAAGRRSSVSLQPFKSPALSASPLGSSPSTISPRTSATRVPQLGSLTEESGIPPPNAQVVAARKSGSLGSEHGVPVPLSGSPKPAPVRYSSSFSHRRSRPSIDRITSKTDEDGASSGRGSATSSIVPPSSGLIAEATTGNTSSGSMQEDDENISDFLKMLDTKKELLGQSTAAVTEAAARRTSNALNRFHRMRDANAALSDSMTSSLMLQQRPSHSSSRQSSGVPAMVAPNSVSTSSSPGKPISPHTPHTPFAPSRLSAAYSHDDAEAQQHAAVEDLQSHVDELQNEDSTQGELAANAGAIDIPTSPRLFLPGYRRSSSAQRRPISSDDDIGDLYGMRSASMGAQDRKTNRPATAGAAVPTGVGENPQSSDAAYRQSVQNTQFSAVNEDNAASDSGSGSNRSPARNVHRSRLSRGSNLRSQSAITPPQGSTSSFGGTGGSIDREVDSGGSASGSWGRSVRLRSGSRVERPETRALIDDDEFLPFAMEKSDFQTTFGRDQSTNRK